jgi:hypothetical protein
MGYRIEGVVYRVWVEGCRVEGGGCGVYSIGKEIIQNITHRIWGIGFMV